MSDPDLPVLEPDDPEEPDLSPESRAERGSYSESRRARLRSRFTRLEVGSVIGNTFTIWFGNLIPFSALALLIYSPAIIVGYLFLDSDPTPQEISRYNVYDMLATFIFFSNLLTGTVVYGVVMQLRGTKGGMGRCLTIGLSRLFHVLGVGILFGIVTSIWMVPAIVMLVAGILKGMDTSSIAISGLLFLVGLIPAFMFLTRFYVAIPAVVIERVGIFAAMSRSSELTKGARGAILGAVFLIFVLLFLMAIPIGMVAGLMQAGSSLTSQFLFQEILSTLLAPLSAIIPAVIYHDLRIGKEGADVDDLAAVFE